jgi:hypothetical protein
VPTDTNDGCHVILRAHPGELKIRLDLELILHKNMFTYIGVQIFPVPSTTVYIKFHICLTLETNSSINKLVKPDPHQTLDKTEDLKITSPFFGCIQNSM